MAVIETSYHDQKEYTNTPIEKRSQFIKERIKEATSNGKTKILKNRQINSYEDLLTHRRGLCAQTRGILQSTTLYDPESIIKRYNISHCTWDIFADAIEIYLQSFDIKSKEELINQAKINDDGNINKYMEETLTENLTFAEIIKEIILNELDHQCENLIFEDGIIVSNNDTNTVPMESILPNIQRHKPAIMVEFSSEETDDIFIASSLKQQNEMKKSNKNVFENVLNNTESPNKESQKRKTRGKNKT